MPITLTVDVFSGRPNPTVVITGPQEAELLERLRPEEKVHPEEVAHLAEPRLGYRGVAVQIEGERPRGVPPSLRVVNGVALGGKKAFRIADAGFEGFVGSSEGPLRPIHGREQQLPQLLWDEIGRSLELMVPWERIRKTPKPKVEPGCRCAPLYEPKWWNVPAIQPYNNCYNYGTDIRTNTFAQPGKAAGAQYGSLTCAAVKKAALADDLIDAPKANNKCPGKGHLVALVIWPNSDFHWYRKGETGYWSHKPGGTAVTNRDNSGALITDPRSADRGPYTAFCTFMIAMHGHVRII
jgi:hypothetical protein